jgi:hypothetical protein
LRIGRACGVLLLSALLALLLGQSVARAEAPELTQFQVARSDEGLLLDFSVQFELPKAVEDALIKGVPLHFVADVTVYSERWYWRDRKLSHASRTWRLAYQPLTRSYRVGFGGLNQSYDTLSEAVAAVRRMTRWKIAEPGQIDDGVRPYLEFSYRLDTTLLPRPMQIGIGGQPDWNLLVEKTQRVGGATP